MAYSIAEAMQATGISRGYFYKLLHEGQLTRRKVGKRTLILREDLQNFLRSRPTAPWRGDGQDHKISTPRLSPKMVEADNE
jgi:excisionase family DNA binding protein